MRQINHSKSKYNKQEIQRFITFQAPPPRGPYQRLNLGAHRRKDQIQH